MSRRNKSPWSDLERPPLRPTTMTRALVRDGSLWREIRILDETASTNSALATEARAGAPEGIVVVAEHQTAGRGRLDREWSSPPRAGLTFSVLLRPTVPDARWTWLPLLIGLTVAAGIREVTGVDVRLKWPNDVLIDHRKVAGVLVERHGSAAVIGVGVNVTTTADELPAGDATSLLLADAATTDRETLLRAILRALEHHYRNWQDSGGELHAVAAAYVEHCETIGQEVRAELPDGTTVVGTATRIDDAGRLVVATPDEERALSVGDVTHMRRSTP